MRGPLGAGVVRSTQLGTGERRGRALHHKKHWGFFVPHDVGMGTAAAVRGSNGAAAPRHTARPRPDLKDLGLVFLFGYLAV